MSSARPWLEQSPRAPTSLLVWARASLWLGILGLAGCLPRTGPEPSGNVDGEPEPRPRCRTSATEALALLERDEAGSCALAVELDGDVLVLRDLDDGEDELVARGRAPSSCGPELAHCQISGRVDPELGPLLILSQRGPESEMPVQVYLGWVEDARVGFTETWYGLPSVVDHTRVGPPWALAPYACAGGLALLPTPRLPEAASEDPPEEIVALAGAWTLGSDADPVAPEPAEPSPDRESCRAALPAIP